MDLVELTDADAARHPWELARYQVVRDLIQKEWPEGETLNIVDFGCGDVFLIERLMEDINVDEIAAIDIALSDEQIRHFQDKLVKKNPKARIARSLEEATLSQSTNLVLLLDVIEHIEDVDNVLQSILAYPTINENTRFLITVPAYNSLFSAHDIFLKHYRRYTKKTLDTAIQAVGLKTMHSHYFFASLLLPRILTKCLERLNPKKALENQKGLGAYKSQASKDQIIKTILYSDYKLLSFFKAIGITLPGLSIYTICKKSV